MDPSTIVNIEFLGPVPLYIGLGIQIITAIVLGGLVGIDREAKMKAAGIRTNIMICIGATLYTSISFINHDMGGVSDPNRMAAQVVSGIGFLGAGAILHGRGNVVGLTTAATIWVVAAIGVTIGSGYPMVATIFTVTTLFVLKLLHPLYRLLELKKDYKDYHVEILARGPVRNSVKQVILSEVNQITDIKERMFDEDHDERILDIYLKIHPRKMKELARELKGILQVIKVNYLQVDSLPEIDRDRKEGREE